MLGVVKLGFGSGEPSFDAFWDDFWPGDEGVRHHVGHGLCYLMHGCVLRYDAIVEFCNSHIHHSHIVYPVAHPLAHPNDYRARDMTHEDLRFNV